MSHRWGLALGSLAWFGTMALYVWGLLVHGRADVGRALLYNAPIAFVFLVVAATLAIQGFLLGFSGFLEHYRWTLVIWAVGLGILYLRLVSKSLEVSGHLAWLPLLTVQAWALGLPYWVVSVGIGGILSAAYLKFVVFQGPSGGPGLFVGLVLVAAFLLQGARARIPVGGE